MFKTEASKFIYYRTYSKWIEEEKRRENWKEDSVKRVISFLRANRGHKVPEKVFKKIEEGLTNFDVMTSMRLIWAAGPAALADNTTIYNCAFLPIDSIDSFAEALYILMCGTGVGFSVENKYVDQLPEVLRLKPIQPELIVINDDKVGWADSIKDLLFNLYNGNPLEFDYSKLRPKGARLKTMGGRSSGPEPLILLHNFIREVFNKAQGRKLTSLECHDILNQIAETSTVGGVRRSSEISLSDFDDLEMRNAKIWPFPQRRAMANNSAVYNKKPEAIAFLQEWGNLAASGTGERGIFNLGSAKEQMPKRRDATKVAGTNPCVTGDTEILTRDGYKRIDSLVDQEVEVWNGFEWSKVTPTVTGENLPVHTVSFSNGQSLTVTNYHKFHIADGYSGKFNIVETKDLQPGMKIVKYKFPIIEVGEEVKDKFAYTQGFISAEGMDGYDFLYLYEPKKMCLNRIAYNKIYKSNYNRNAIKFQYEHREKAFVPFDWNLRGKLEWLAGLFDGDGTELIEGGLQLVSIDRDFLLNIQKLLNTLGINSKVTLGKKSGHKNMPDGQGGQKEYFCKTQYRICIGAVQMQNLKRLGLKCERLKFDKEPQRDASQFITITDITESGVADKVYCFTEPKRNTVIFNGILTGNCGEILLRPYQFCNLSSVVIRPDDDLDSLLEKVETATWIGAIQSSFTYFPYLRDIWRKNCEEERLLGVSLSGQMDNPKLLTPDVLKALKSRAQKVAKRASDKLGINYSTAITCVKPEGTSSQLVYSASGLHVWYSKYFIRRYRISATDPLLKMMINQGVKVKPEVGQQEPNINTYVIEFPMMAPKGAITKDMVTAIDQLEHYKKLQENWCEHNASCTIYVKPDEWFEVGNWVYKNWDIVNGLSFLPDDGGKYELAPLEAITKEKYEELSKAFPEIDYSQLSKFETEDQTEGSKEIACTGGVCDI